MDGMMRPSRRLVLLFMWIGSLAAASIHLKTRELDPRPDRQGYLGIPVKRRTEGTSHYLVQFSGPVRAEIFQQLRERGASVTGYVPESTLVIAAPDDFSVEGLPIRWIGRLEQQDKISPLISASTAPAAYIVEFHSDVDMHEARAMVREHGLRRIENPYLSGHHLLVEGS